MSAFLLKWKKIARIVAGGLSVAFTLSVFIYAQTLSRAQAVETGKNFYFLVSNKNSLAVSTEITKLQGGAGYALTCKEGEYAAYSVYFSEAESHAAQRSVEKTGESAQIILFQSKPLYLKTAKEKEQVSSITGAFRSLYGCMQVLNGEISRIEKGATQDSSKRLLQTLSRQFSFLERQYGQTINGYASVCKNAEKSLLEATSNIVYAKDLRHLLCELSVAYADLSKNFSL